LAFGVLFSASCTIHKPEPIFYSKEACAHCKMMIFDKRFGGELLTKKGKAYKFDSIECMNTYAKQHADLLKDGFATFVVNSFKNGELIDINNALFYEDVNIKSPMGKGYLASDSPSDFKLNKELDAKKILIKWDEIQKKLE
jgi:copper chaperone NosL